MKCTLDRDMTTAWATLQRVYLKLIYITFETLVLPVAVTGRIYCAASLT